MARDSIPFHHA